MSCLPCDFPLSNSTIYAAVHNRGEAMSMILCRGDIPCSHGEGCGRRRMHAPVYLPSNSLDEGQALEVGRLCRVGCGEDVDEQGEEEKRSNQNPGPSEHKTAGPCHRAATRSPRLVALIRQPLPWACEAPVHFRLARWAAGAVFVYPSLDAAGGAVCSSPLLGLRYACGARIQEKVA